MFSDICESSTNLFQNFSLSYLEKTFLERLLILLLVGRHELRSTFQMLEIHGWRAVDDSNDDKRIYWHLLKHTRWRELISKKPYSTTPNRRVNAIVCRALSAGYGCIMTYCQHESSQRGYRTRYYYSASCQATLHTCSSLVQRNARTISTDVKNSLKHTVGKK